MAENIADEYNEGPNQVSIVLHSQTQWCFSSRFQ